MPLEKTAAVARFTIRASQLGRCPRYSQRVKSPLAISVSQWGRPNSVRKPQKAAAPKMIMNATPVRRPEAGVLLQDWSTATTQTMKSRIAPAPSSFSHTISPQVREEPRQNVPVRSRHRYILAGSMNGSSDSGHLGACRERSSGWQDCAHILFAHAQDHNGAHPFYCSGRKE
jgi:hypothetical protein